MQALILAGGRGVRLHPYTLALPKPLLPVGGIPILETIVRQLCFYGFRDIVISTGYLGEYIRIFFQRKDLKALPVEIRFVDEIRPLGTAGSIALMEDHHENFLVINGDILTSFDYSKLFNEHLKRKACMTLAVRDKEVRLSLGVLTLDATNSITEFQEKPTYTFKDNAGIYICNRDVLDFVKKDEYLDMNELVTRLIDARRLVTGFEMGGDYYWIDIGQHADYETANKIFESERSRFVP